MIKNRIPLEEMSVGFDPIITDVLPALLMDEAAIVQCQNRFGRVATLYDTVPSQKRKDQFGSA